MTLLVAAIPLERGDFFGLRARRGPLQCLDPIPPVNRHRPIKTESPGVELRCGHCAGHAARLPMSPRANNGHGRHIAVIQWQGKTQIPLPRCNKRLLETCGGRCGRATNMPHCVVATMRSSPQGGRCSGWFPETTEPAGRVACTPISSSPHMSHSGRFFRDDQINGRGGRRHRIRPPRSRNIRDKRPT